MAFGKLIVFIVFLFISGSSAVRNITVPDDFAGAFICQLGAGCATASIDIANIEHEDFSLNGPFGTLSCDYFASAHSVKVDGGVQSCSPQANTCRSSLYCSNTFGAGQQYLLYNPICYTPATGFYCANNGTCTTLYGQYCFADSTCGGIVV
jgi:hypothetical protein